MDTYFTPPAFEHPIQEAVFYRGAFLHHYAIVEFIVSDLILRAIYRKEYRHFGKLPGEWRAKLDRLGQARRARAIEFVLSEMPPPCFPNHDY